VTGSLRSFPFELIYSQPFRSSPIKEISGWFAIHNSLHWRLGSEPEQLNTGSRVPFPLSNQIDLGLSCGVRVTFPEGLRSASNPFEFIRRTRIKRGGATAPARPVSTANKANVLTNAASVVQLWLIPRRASWVFRDLLRSWDAASRLTPNALRWMSSGYSSREASTIHLKTPARPGPRNLCNPLGWMIRVGRGENGST